MTFFKWDTSGLSIQGNFMKCDILLYGKLPKVTTVRNNKSQDPRADLSALYTQGGNGGKESRLLEAKEEEKTNLEVLKLYVLSNLLNAKPLIGFCVD